MPHRPGQGPDGCRGGGQNDVHCYSCDEDEHLIAKYYLVCFECNHVWRSGKALVDAFNKMGQDTYEALKDEFPDALPFKPVSRPVQVRFCPLCLHSF